MNTNYLWQKDEGTVHPKIQQFLTGEDILFDRSLFSFDIQASKTYAQALVSCNILTTEEFQAIADALEQLLTDFKQGLFVLDERFEDSHSAIEQILTEKLGETGQKIHTGRSRNDQVLVALRLYEKEQLKKLSQLVQKLGTSLLSRAETDMHTPMPGYTHLQRAVPSSFGMWFAGTAEGFIDDLELIQSTAQSIDRCPLGTAAGFGVNLDLPREWIAQELGFGGININPIAAQNSRGKYELNILSTLLSILHDIRRFAWDLSLFTAAEFDFFRLKTGFYTGSSIMPNKRNPDVIEMLRGAYATGYGYFSELQSLLSLPSGYHRELQWVKKCIIQAFEHIFVVLEITHLIIPALEINETAASKAITPEMFATDHAIEAAKTGKPFRKAYREVLEQIKTADLSARDSLKSRLSLGSPGNPALGQLWERLRN